jgi:16S rRNA (guanine966-N2)-methyltransferase
VREAIFDVLCHNPSHGVELNGARLVELFAGSGALGIEALSRGAREAIFVERDPSAAALLRRNLRDLGLEERAEVWTQDATRSRAALKERAPFDLLLMDPPYRARKDTLDALETLAPAELLGYPGLMVLEQAAGAGHPSLEGFTPPLARRWGSSEALFFQRHESIGPENGGDLE